MKRETSYRTILRSSAIMGTASVANILIGLVRTKVVAVLLGAAGVGVFGLLQNMVAVASTVAGLGLGAAGTRQIAKESGNPESVSAVRATLFWCTLALSLIGALAFFLLRDQLATRVGGDARLGPPIGWLALGVALSVASVSQNALLQGLRRIGDIAKLQISSSVLSSALGVAALYAWGEGGVVPYLLSAPLASFLLGHWYVSRLERPASPHPRLRLLLAQSRELTRIGLAFMISGLVLSLGFLVVRSLIQRQLGPVELGHYQAAWAISMTYISFILSAMATDYYPRLTEAINDREKATRLVNEQTEVALLLAGPVLVGIMALAPWLISLLYTPDFVVAANILRWQILGDVLKIVSWPLGFVLLAVGASRTFMLAETFAIAVFVAGVWTGLPIMGIQATGVAFFTMYVASLPLSFFYARYQIGFTWKSGVIRQMLLVLGVSGLIMILAQWSELAASFIGCVSAASLGLQALGRLGDMVDPASRLGKLVGAGQKVR